MKSKPLYAAFVLAAGLGVASPAMGKQLRLTFTSAEIDGRTVQAHAHPRSLAPLSDLACLSMPGLHHLAAACGSHPSGGMAPQVDPVLRVELGGRVIRTYPVPGTLSPRWDYDVIVDDTFLDREGSATLTLHDYHGPGAEPPLCSGQVALRTLRKPAAESVRLVPRGGPPGGAERGGEARPPCEVRYKVAEITDTSPRRHRFFVPANRQMAELARAAHAGQGYTPIRVAEGEIVEVTAQGTVRPAARRHPDRVAGPAGIPTIQTKIQFNQPGFRGCPECNHAALIGYVGARGLVIGPRRRFPVEHAGLLLLAINDVRVDDNEGGFDVTVEVSLPAPTETPGRKAGGEGERWPSGIDPRVVEQAIDRHEAELLACAKGAPTGEVTLVFTIAADGRPLGLTAADAPAGLRAAIECMRKKALRWRLPPPREQVTARYPLSLDPS